MRCATIIVQLLDLVPAGDRLVPVLGGDQVTWLEGGRLLRASPPVIGRVALPCRFERLEGLG